MFVTVSGDPRDSSIANASSPSAYAYVSRGGASASTGVGEVSHSRDAAPGLPQLIATTDDAVQVAAKRPPTPASRLVISLVCSLLSLVLIIAAAAAPWLYAHVSRTNADSYTQQFTLQHFTNCRTSPPLPNVTAINGCVSEANNSVRLSSAFGVCVFAAVTTLLCALLAASSAATRVCRESCVFQSCSGPVFLLHILSMLAMVAVLAAAATAYDDADSFLQISSAARTPNATVTVLYPGLIAAAVSVATHFMGACAIACCAPQPAKQYQAVDDTNTDAQAQRAGWEVVAASAPPAYEPPQLSGSINAPTAPPPVDVLPRTGGVDYMVPRAAATATLF